MISELDSGMQHMFAAAESMTNPKTGESAATTFRPVIGAGNSRPHVGDDGNLHTAPCHCLARSEAPEHLSNAGYDAHEDVSSDGQELDSQDADSETSPFAARFYATFCMERGYHHGVFADRLEIAGAVRQIDGVLHFSMHQKGTDGEWTPLASGVAQDLASGVFALRTASHGLTDQQTQHVWQQLVGDAHLSELGNDARSRTDGNR